MDQNLGETWPSIGRQLTSTLNTPTVSQPLPTISGKDPFPGPRLSGESHKHQRVLPDPQLQGAYSMRWNFGVQYRSEAKPYSGGLRGSRNLAAGYRRPANMAVT